MAYATPADFVQAFGLDETCMLLMDEERLLTTELLVAGLRELAAGGTVMDDVAAQALERLTRRLHNTSNLMDGYLGSAVSLPISSAKPELMGVLQECCLALARCALSDDPDNATDRMDAACSNWRQWLRDVAAGKIKLVDADGSVAAGGRTVHGNVPSAYNWGMYSHFGGGFRT